MKILKPLMIGAVLLGSVFVGNGFAGAIKKCENIQISKIHIEGERDDSQVGSNVSNMVVLETRTDVCDGFRLFYIRLKNPSYSAMLTTILNAKNTATELDLYYDVDSSIEGATGWREIDIVVLN
ncbi:MAG: hypothetical protein OCC49_13735 [Fibrobacterales bacterium]